MNHFQVSIEDKTWKKNKENKVNEETATSNTSLFN